MPRPPHALVAALLLPALAGPVLGAEAAARAGSGALLLAQYDPNQPAPPPGGPAPYGVNPGVPDYRTTRPERAERPRLTQEERQRRRELRAQRRAAREARLARMTPEQRATYEARRAERRARMPPDQRAERAVRRDGRQGGPGAPDGRAAPYDPGRQGDPGAYPADPRRGSYDGAPDRRSDRGLDRGADREARRAAREARLARMTPEERSAYEARRTERRAARQGAGSSAE